MHPLKERRCDHLLHHPGLATPPEQPEEQKPPHVRKPKEFKMPERFPLVPKDFYELWCVHQKGLQMAKHKVDDSPPSLFPEMYLKPRRLNLYARELEHNMNLNKELLKRINYIQRTGGFVDCWMREATDRHTKRLCNKRQRNVENIRQKNAFFYTRLLAARSEQPCTKELEALWQETKNKLIMGSTLPFILFKRGRIDRGMRDPAFDKPPDVHRTRVVMDIWVRNGAKIGRVIIELFSEIVPQTCKLFLRLVKGDKAGHAYAGTRFFRVVPNLFCCGGDVTKDNGFGCYLPEGELQPMGAESFELRHSVPGVLSMAVTSCDEVCGQFNIIFKPLPQFDEKHVVFGRIVAGPVETLERISVLGLPLGTTSSDCIISYCGYYTKNGTFRSGANNTIKFPVRRKKPKQ